MTLSLCVLASSSAGNCTYVASAQTAILIDAGLSGKELLRRLVQVGVAAGRIQAVCLTHEHGDHTVGLSVLHKRLGLQLYANSSTVEALGRQPNNQALPWNIFTTGSPFLIGDLRIEPFSVPHDAYDPVGFIVENDGSRVGVVTDMGMATELIRQRLRQCRALVVEANHDERLVTNAKRPWSLKQRVLGRQGHLSNRHAAELLAQVADANLQAVFLAHLSGECNRPELAQDTVAKALRAKECSHVHVHLTYPDRASDVWQG
jgi:phosphoribosyl 1,2-cyclic phosphodiesterase